MKNYRKIWEEYHNASLLPGIEIHHIDGNHSNNHPTNLLAVTPEEHYQIHLANGDYGAASLISNRAILPIDDVIKVRKIAGKIAGTNSKNNNLGFFGLSDEVRRANSSKAGKYTRDNKLGIHAINADPVLSKQNSSHAGKISHSKKAGFHSRLYQQESVGGTRWWKNDTTGKRCRAKECPGPNWSNTMGNNSCKGKPNNRAGIPWWNDGEGNRVRSCNPPGENWKKGMK